MLGTPLPASHFSIADGVKQTMFDIDFGKRPKGNTANPFPLARYVKSCS